MVLPLGAGRAWLPAVDPPPATVFAGALRRALARLGEAHVSSEAAVIAIAHDGHRLHWLSIGDCRDPVSAIA